MSTIILENPKLSIEELNLIKKKIISNQATVKEYERLNYLLSTIGAGEYLNQKLKENNIYNFDDYIFERNKPITERKREVDGIILGNILGVIESLEKFLER